jgi:hypothetical protein
MSFGRVQRCHPSARRVLLLLLLLLLLLPPPLQPRGRIDQELAQGRAAEVRGELPVDLQGTPVVRFPVTVGGCQLTLLLTLDRELRAVALGAQLNAAVRIEPEIVAAGDVAQSSLLDLEILGCSAQRSHHRADVEVCHAGPPCGLAEAPRTSACAGIGEARSDKVAGARHRMNIAACAAFRRAVRKVRWRATATSPPLDGRAWH